MITCDNAGINFDGDIRAEWHPDEVRDSKGGEEVGHTQSDGESSTNSAGCEPSIPVADQDKRILKRPVWRRMTWPGVDKCASREIHISDTDDS